MSALHRPRELPTLAVHADRGVEDTDDIAPPIHVTTTFDSDHDGTYSYSRHEQPTRRRLEQVLDALEGGRSIVYPSGQAAAYALLRRLRPRRIAVTGGYFGTHDLFRHLAHDGLEVMPLDGELRLGDLVWLETPKNPACEIEDIEWHCGRAHEVGATVCVDSTLATPVLQNPLTLGADVVVHSSTKFLAGHSDALGGVLVVADKALAASLRDDRETTGAILGNLEAWLTLRSLRTLSARVSWQSSSAAGIAAWLSERVPRVWHPSLRSHPGFEIAQRQMSGGGGVFAFELEDPEQAQSFPCRLRLFRSAVSLGGVETLIDWRHRHDPLVSPMLLRVSVGLESPSDLIDDLEQALGRGRRSATGGEGSTVDTGHARSNELFHLGQQLLPAGVSSPIRTFAEVTGGPVFPARARGSHLVDVDGNEYVDFVCALGPLILGHAHPTVTRAIRRQAELGTVYGLPTEQEYSLAGRILDTTASLDRIRFVCSGTEAVMSALRLAKAYTGRPKILTFEGCYHGHSDIVLAESGSSQEPAVLRARYNSVDDVQAVFATWGHELAAAIVEPYACNMGLVLPEPGFLAALRTACSEAGTLLVFDEVVTGFRLQFGSVSPALEVEPDLTTFGKIIGGGTPIGAYGGKHALMRLLEDRATLFQGGTFAGNPLSIAAGLATLDELQRPGTYEGLERLGQRLEDGIRRGFSRSGLRYGFERKGSICSFILIEGVERVRDHAGASRQDAALYADFHGQMVQRGFLMPPSVEETFFLSTAHTEAEIDAFATAAVEVLTELTQEKASTQRL